MPTNIRTVTISNKQDDKSISFSSLDGGFNFSVNPKADIDFDLQQIQLDYMLVDFLLDLYTNGSVEVYLDGAVLNYDQIRDLKYINVSMVIGTIASILDEGSLVESNVNSIDFVGLGVTASTGAANKITVTIPGSNLQNAYDRSASGSKNIGLAAGAGEGIRIRDNAVPIGTDLFAIQDSAGTINYLAINSTGISVTGNISILQNNELRLLDVSNFYVGFKPPVLVASQIWTLPAADGAAGRFLQTNGAGVLSWALPTYETGTTPADVANAAAFGVATTFSRSDHIHRGVFSIQDAAAAALYGAVTLTGGLDIALNQVGQNITIYSTGPSFTTNPVSTTNADLTTIATIPITDDIVVEIEVYIVARRTNSADRAGYIRRAVVYREAAGAATIQGSVDTPLTRESDASWNCTLVASGNSILVRVQGAVGHDINWKSRYINILEVG